VIGSSGEIFRISCLEQLTIIGDEIHHGSPPPLQSLALLDQRRQRRVSLSAGWGDNQSPPGAAQIFHK